MEDIAESQSENEDASNSDSEASWESSSEQGDEEVVVPPLSELEKEKDLNEMVQDVFASVGLVDMHTTVMEAKKAWGVNKEKKDRDIAKNFAVSSKRERKEKEKASTSSTAQAQSGSSSTFSWHNLPQPVITPETKFVVQGGQKVPIIMMPLVKSNPPVNTWTHTPTNFRAPDDVPKHLPYFEDDVVRRDEKLVKEIEQALGDQLTVSKSCKITATDDKLFYEAVGMIQKKLNRDNAAVLGAESLLNSLVPKDEVFEAITKIFPKYGTFEQTKDKFMELLCKFHERGSELNLPSTSLKFPNIDNDVDFGTTPMDRDKSLNSYRKLFCRRCYIYDCFIHEEKDREQFVAPEFLEKKGPFRNRKKSCGVDCYTNNVSKNQEMSSTSQKSNNSARDNEEQQFPPWKPAEISMFRALKDAFPGNFCAISEIMLKPCKEVYEFALKETAVPQGLDMPAVSGTDLAKPKPSTSKKSLSTPSKAQKSGMVWGRLSVQEMARITKTIYKPCFHPGIPCGNSENICSCKASKTPCEKFCACAADCKHRNIGCRCNSTCNYKSCPCVAAYRECDPDLCSTCGAAEVDKNKIKCKNVAIQKMQKKKLLWAKSDIPNAGWGIFAGEPIAKNELISEYVGEIISSEEADHRSLENKARCHTYIFEMNDSFAVDAGRIGTEIRFANHSDSPNGDFRIMKVNTDHRIGIYANRNIEAGEEIFLSYQCVITENEEVATGGKKDKKELELKAQESPKSSNNKKPLKKSKK